MNSVEDWQSRIKPNRDISNYDFATRAIEEEVIKKRPPVGAIFFARRRHGKLRTRYTVMLVTTDWGSFSPTNTEIIYHKSRKRWQVHIDGQAVNDGYITLKSAKTSLLPHPLDRLAAEADLTA